MAAAARALGLNVVGITSRSSRSQLEALLRESDIISLNCPLNKHTLNLLGCVPQRILWAAQVLPALVTGVR